MPLQTCNTFISIVCRISATSRTMKLSLIDSFINYLCSKLQVFGGYLDSLIVNSRAHIKHIWFAELLKTSALRLGKIWERSHMKHIREKLEKW